MNEGLVAAAFLLLMGLLVARIVRENREQAAGESHTSLLGSR